MKKIKPYGIGMLSPISDPIINFDWKSDGSGIDVKGVVNEKTAALIKWMAEKEQGQLRSQLIELGWQPPKEDERISEETNPAALKALSRYESAVHKRSVSDWRNADDHAEIEKEFNRAELILKKYLVKKA